MVYFENQNAFRLRNRCSTLAGKPDIITVKGRDSVVIDPKTVRHSPQVKYVKESTFDTQSSTSSGITTRSKSDCPAAGATKARYGPLTPDLISPISR